MSIRVVIVDDHRIVREGMRAMLETHPEINVVGEANDGKSALDVIARLVPDVAIVDLEMPGTDGVSLLERLPEVSPTTRGLVLTAHGSDEQIMRAIQAGAQGYLLKGAGIAELVSAIETVAAGGSSLGTDVTERVMGAMGRLLRTGEIDRLSERERAILVRMGQGMNNRDIGDDLGLAERTVKFYATIIFQKLHVTNRAEAVAKGIRDGLI